MSIAEELADRLAQDVIEAMDIMEDEDLPKDIAKLLGASSQTSEEAFLTAMRVRLANRKARAMLAERLKNYEARLKGSAG